MNTSKLTKVSDFLINVKIPNEHLMFATLRFRGRGRLCPLGLVASLLVLDDELEFVIKSHAGDVSFAEIGRVFNIKEELAVKFFGGTSGFTSYAECGQAIKDYISTNREYTFDEVKMIPGTYKTIQFDHIIINRLGVVVVFDKNSDNLPMIPMDVVWGEHKYVKVADAKIRFV